MKSRRLLTLPLLPLFFASAASADPIIELLEGGTSPDFLGGYEMTDFVEPLIPQDGCGGWGDGVYSADSPISGEVQFMAQGGTTPLCMSVQDPNWWEWDHGNVFTTEIHWIELIMPTDTRAFSFWVGAEFVGRGWIEAIDDYGSTTRTYFGGNTGVNLGPGSTPGFGVYTADSCSSISKIIIEPIEWGTGNFSINQDPCVQVSEPSSLFLFGGGLLAMGLVAARRRKVQVAV